MTTTLPLIAIVVAMLLIRAGWGGRGGAAAAGWTIAVAALLTLTWRDGAWGLAVGSVAGIAAALAIVAQAAWTSPARATRAPRVAPSIALPRRRRDLMRRIAVFVLAVPVAFAAAQWLAFAAQAAARRHGVGEADAIVLSLFLQPTLWAIVIAVQLTRAGPARMIAPPVVAAVVGALLWGAA